jgi:hypothetical protein
VAQKVAQQLLPALNSSAASIMPETSKFIISH